MGVRPFHDMVGIGQTQATIPIHFPYRLLSGASSMIRCDGAGRWAMDEDPAPYGTWQPRRPLAAGLSHHADALGAGRHTDAVGWQRGGVIDSPSLCTLLSLAYGSV